MVVGCCTLLGIIYFSFDLISRMQQFLLRCSTSGLSNKSTRCCGALYLKQPIYQTLSNQQCKMPKSLLRSSGSHRLISTWCLISHQPKCNLGVVKFHNEELYVEFQAHFSIAFSSTGSWPHKS